MLAAPLHIGPLPSGTDPALCPSLSHALIRHRTPGYIISAGLMNWMVRQSTELEVNMNACERIIEFTNLTPERPPIVPGELREK